MKVARLFVISGPSGAGKGTLVEHALKRRSDLALSISATTRHQRPHEIPGVHYHFMTEAEFDKLIDQDGFVEWANVHGNKYGTPVKEVEEKLESGHSLILEIDPQGAFQVLQKVPDAVLIFITPPSVEELEARLRGRGTETESEVQTRLHNMEAEIKTSSLYDAVIVNDDIDRATTELLDIIARYEQE